MKNIIIGAVALIGVGLTGCTDASRAAAASLGNAADIVCYSGGGEVFRDTSTGKVEAGESGVFYKSKNTNRYVRVFADCIVSELP